MPRSEEHTSELQSLRHLVCRLLLEKKTLKNHLDHAVLDAGAVQCVASAALCWAGVVQGVHHCELATVDISTVVRFFFFFFNDTATTEIYTLSLHDALPI